MLSLEIFKFLKIVKILFIFILCVISILPELIYVHNKYNAHRYQKRVFGPLELELQLVVSHHVGAGNQTMARWESSQCS